MALKRIWPLKHPHIVRFESFPHTRMLAQSTILRLSISVVSVNSEQWRRLRQVKGTRMLWRRQRRLLAVAQFIAVLGLIPAFAVMVWGIGDGSAVLAAWGIPSPLPPIGATSMMAAPVILGGFIAIFKTMCIVYAMRERAILGNVDAMAPAKPLVAMDAPPPPLPIPLVWRRSRRSRQSLMIWFVISLVPLIGFGVLLAWVGQFDFVAPQNGADLFVLGGLVALYTVLFALIPLVLLREALRPPQGVVADDHGVSAWHGRETITWADARLLEVQVGRAMRQSWTVYTLYARDGNQLAWRTRAEDSRYISTHSLVGSETNDSQQRAAAILALAHSMAGLTPRTFDEAAVDSSSNLAAPGNLPLGAKALPGTWPGSVTALVGITAGCGIATLAMRSPVFPAVSLIAASALAISTLWSLALAVSEALTMPRLLESQELPTWRTPPTVAADGVAQLQQERNRSRRLGMTMRALLMLIGSIAAIIASVAALAAGRVGIDLFNFWMNLVWLVFAVLVSAVRVSGQFDRDEVALLADAAGIQNLRSRHPKAIPWADIASLRFTWSRAAGFRYTATTQSKDEISWASQSRQWRDEEPDLAATGIHAPAVDGDTFAAIVAARTGLIPAQELN